MGSMDSMKLLKVTWKDNSARAGWVDLNDDSWKPNGPVKAVSVGFLVFEDREQIGLAKTLCEENSTAAHLTFILKKNIIAKKSV